MASFDQQQAALKLRLTQAIARNHGGNDNAKDESATSLRQAQQEKRNRPMQLVTGLGTGNGMSSAALGSSNYGEQQSLTISDNGSEEGQGSYRNLRMLRRMAEAVSSGNLVEAQKMAAREALNVRRRISEEGFDGATFLTVLLLSLIGDVADLLTLGTIGYLVDKMIAIFLFLIFFLKAPVLKKYLIKKFIWPVVIKFIPGLNIFPSYTISAILLKIKMDKDKRQAIDELNRLTAENK